MKYLLAILIMASLQLYADPIFRVNHGASQPIDKFGICKKIKNNSATKDIMVPTNTTSEWASFLAHLPTSVQTLTCFTNPDDSNGPVGRGQTNVIQSDDKIILGGEGTPSIQRLNTDGTVDSSFAVGVGFDAAVYDIAIQTDGKIVVAGEFKKYKGATANRIARLNTDGTLDTSFTTGTGFGTTDYIHSDSLAIQSDGKIVVGGNFSEYSGASIEPLVRINSDGTRDTSFVVPTNTVPEAVKKVAIQSDGKILVGGDSYSSIPKNITRLNSNGTKDTGFNKGTSVNGIVWGITVQPDDKILIGGEFTSYNGVTSKHFARLNSDGTLDTAFTTAIGTGFNNFTTTSIIQTDGKIIVGGYYTQFNGSAQNRIVRLNSDGTKDTSFAIGSGFGEGVDDLGLFSSGRILATGSFCSYQGNSSCYIDILNTDGSL